jgi:hypothetical protein
MEATDLLLRLPRLPARVAVAVPQIILVLVLAGQMVGLVVAPLPEVFQEGLLVLEIPHPYLRPKEIMVAMP